MSALNEPIELEIKRTINSKVNLDLDRDILRTGRLGELSFEESKGELLVLFKLFKMLLKVDLKLLPEEHLKKLNNSIKSVIATIDRMQSFNVVSDSPAKNRYGIQTQFNQEYDQLLPLLLRSLNFVNLTMPEFSVEQVRQEMEGARSEVEQLKKNFKELVDNHTRTVNQSAQEFGMRNYASTFLDESQTFRRAANRWFIASVVVLITTIAAAVLFLLVNKEYMDKLDIIQFTITKVLVLTVLFYAVTMCFKNYKAQKHNEILNKHRSNALLTFEAFTGSKEDPQTKAAVLLAATQTIFGNQQTGYGSHDSSDSDFPAKIIEIIKTPSTK